MFSWCCVVYSRKEDGNVFLRIALPCVLGFYKTLKQETKSPNKDETFLSQMLCTRCASYSSLTTTTTFLSSVFKRTKKNSFGIIVTSTTGRNSSSFISSSSSSSFERREQRSAKGGFVVGVGKKKTTNKAPAFSVVAAAATEETTTETAASKRKAFPTMMKTMNTFLGVTNELGASLLALVALLCNCAYFSANTTTSGASGFAIVVIILMNKIALSALLVKTLAAFALPVDIQSYLAYATFPWRPREAFANKKVLITGASQGLGEAIAYYVSSFGANVVLASRNVKNLEGVGKKCLENGAKAVEVVAFDALKPESAEMLAKAASEAFNDGDDEKEDGDSNNNKSYCCDYAFLCAGASQSASAFDVTESAERELFNLNALSTIQVLKNILPSMIARNRGHVCVISSMAAICPAPGQSSYAASKAALSKYVDSLRAEIGHTAKNVTLTNCYPGPIATGFNGKKRVVFNATGVNENHPKGLAKGRLPVETVAKMAVKLTSFGQYSIHLAPKLVMFLSRCVHFCPTVAYAVMDKLGPKRAQAAKKGESLYELKVKDA